MNLDSIYRELTAEDLDSLERHMRFVLDHHRPVTLLEDPAAYHAYAKWHDLGGPEALQRATHGTEPKHATTMKELIRHFTDTELDHVRDAMVATRDKQQMTEVQENQYARYLLLGGKLTRIKYREAEEERIIVRYTIRLLLANLARKRTRKRVSTI